MRSLLFIGTFCLPPLLGIGQTTEFQIVGSLPKSVVISKIFLSYRENNRIMLDSSIIDHGKFQFAGTLTEPTQAALVYDKAALREKNPTVTKELLSFFIGPGKTQITVENKLKEAKLSGNKIISDYSLYRQYMAPADEGLERVNIKFYSSTPEQQNNTAYVDKLKVERDSFFTKKSQLQSSYIKAYPDSYFSAVALRDFTLFTFELSKVEPMFLSLSEKVQNSGVGKAIAQRIKETKMVAIGQTAPDFEQKDQNGKSVRLSDFRGKYVLLDFWASWCLPCRAENPNVKSAYKKFKEKQFDILQVSLDDEKNNWIQAIEKDGLNWPQVSDLQGWENNAARKYYITGIPQNFLIDPMGKIVGINLKGKALLDKLAELL